MNPLSDTFSIQITSPTSSGMFQYPPKPENNLYTNLFSSSSELQNFLNTYGESVDGAKIYEGLIYPIRTDNFKDFLADFFLPTTINYALEIHFIALIIFASITDLISLPIRFITTPFRIIYNLVTEIEHPLYQFFRDNTSMTEEQISQLKKVRIAAKFDTCSTIESENTQTNQKCREEKEVKGTLTLKKIPGGESLFVSIHETKTIITDDVAAWPTFNHYYQDSFSNV